LVIEAIRQARATPAAERSPGRIVYCGSSRGRGRPCTGAPSSASTTSGRSPAASTRSIW
jgi:hypothetical protein